MVVNNAQRMNQGGTPPDVSMQVKRSVRIRVIAFASADSAAISQVAL